MGGDDSQKLLPRRGVHSSPGRKPPAQLPKSTISLKLAVGISMSGQAGLMASATARLGHSCKAPVVCGVLEYAECAAPPLWEKPRSSF